MTQPRFILALILFTLFAFPASAGDCLRLCDYSFMQTATAQDINAEIDKGADLHARTTDSLSPLHFAALSGNTEAVSALLAAGADVEVRTKNNSTPLHLAAIRGNAPTITALLKAGANREARNRLAAPPSLCGGQWQRRNHHSFAERRCQRQGQRAGWRNPL